MISDQKRMSMIIILGIMLFGAIVISRSVLFNRVKVSNTGSAETRPLNEEPLAGISESDIRNVGTAPNIIVEPLRPCAEGQLFFTSLPAKCLNPDGELVTVPESPLPIFLKQDPAP